MPVDSLDETQQALLRKFQENPDTWFVVETLGPLPQLVELRWGFYALRGRDAWAWFAMRHDWVTAAGRYFATPVGSSERSVPNEGDPVPPQLEEFPPLSVGEAYDPSFRRPRQHTPRMFCRRRPPLTGPAPRELAVN